LLNHATNHTQSRWVALKNTTHLNFPVNLYL
jgi:hypothetical protein